VAKESETEVQNKASVTSISEVRAEVAAEPEAESAPDIKQAAVSIPATGKNSDRLENSEHWIAVFSELPLEGMLKSICGQLSFRQRAEDQLVFDIDASASGVLSDKYQSKFAEILSGHLGQNLKVAIESEDNANESPTARAARLHVEALEAAESELLDSDAAQSLTETFNAKLVPGSVNLK
jgi:DNA polymerase-3 subunit gamma/tau